jgi:hypothetical protein
MAVDAGLAVQDVNTAKLTARLKEQGAVFEYVPPPQRRQLEALRKAATKSP